MKLDLETRAELRASGLACQRLAERCYLVASGSQVGESYTVVTDTFDWPTWQCTCQGGRPGNRCQHKRRVRQELEAEAKRAARKTGPAAGRATLKMNGRAVQ